MEKAANKANRLAQIETLLLAHPEGLHPAEIARRLGVNRSTVGRYLPDLPKHIYIDDLDGGKWKVDRTADLMNVRLNLHESLAIHLATRLLATRLDKHNPHAAAALRKLAAAMERWAPRISLHMAGSADAMDGTGRRLDPRYLQVLETLTLAWAEERKVSVWHRHEQSGQVHTYTFSPYFIEPYAVGQTTHAIGLREPPGKLRTFKIERIERIERLPDPYTIPADFDPTQALAHAWGIWYTESAPVEVALRFHPRVANRVKETCWHPSEKLEEQPDGSLVWRAQVAEPQEMLPWIRGWGADCEVLEPGRLRESLMAESKRLCVLYGINDEGKPTPFSFLWAKTKRSTGVSHLLIYHLLDVALTAQKLWDQVLGASVKRDFSKILKLDEESVGRWIAFLAGLHDLGKASPTFQRKYPDSVPLLEATGLPFPKIFSNHSTPHGTISAWALGKLLEEDCGFSKPTARKLATVLGGHHGVWPRPSQVMAVDGSIDSTGGSEWDQVRRNLLVELKDFFGIENNLALPSETESLNSFLMLLSGLISIADWIGSMEEYFPFESQPMELKFYAERAANQANEVLHRLGWTGWQASGHISDFETLFDFQPYEMQHQIIEATQNLHPPVLIIIELPTGSGKTEIALYLADKIVQMLGLGGIYIAMPSMATSNQMYTRVGNFLRRRYPGDLINYHLVHGQAGWHEQAKETMLSAVGDDNETRLAAMSWFLPRKRTLLAPFAVGTVDQALLSVLQTKHFFVRQYGLGHKAIVFDEVHAYDTYMSTLFHQLLSWLRANGSSAIILSATLTAQTRRDLIQAYTGCTDLPPIDSAYPLLTIANKSEINSLPLPPPPSRTLHLSWIEPDEETIVSQLHKVLANGGCAAVIVNRVARAQTIYKAIQKANLIPAEDLILFHARFPAQWRSQIEERVLDRFGKENKNRRTAILVATQVVEQSLDLDFDYMISDLAPIDLVLQRAGRLHRHHNTLRPHGLQAPVLVLTRPEETEGIPRFKNDAFIYDEDVLLRSYLTLFKQGKEIHLPEQITELIEEVYCDNHPPDLEERIAAHLEKISSALRNDHQKEIFEAKIRMVHRPTDGDLLTQTNLGLDDEDPHIHHALQALTRLSEPGIDLVCLHQTLAGLALDPDGSGAPLDITLSPDTGLVEQLLKRSLHITHRSLVEFFLAQPVPKGWKEKTALRYHRPVIFISGEYHLPGLPYVLRLSKNVGLEIQKEVE